MNNADPLEIPIIFFRVGWMEHYQGVTSQDSIVGGGSYVTDNGFGHEIFNFQPFKGKVYGYVQPPGRKERWLDARIKIDRLGAGSEDESISAVLVVWVATSPQGGGFIVGWYKNATLYRNYQVPPVGSGRRFNETEIGFYVIADCQDTVLLSPDARVFPIPRQERGGIGQSNVWYANEPEYHRDFRREVLEYVATRQLPRQADHKSTGGARQLDPDIRQQVEKAAIEATWSFFTSLNYNLRSFEKDNLGWDLTATLGNRELRLEVKGLSGPDIVVELTPNEYRAMKEHRDIYRVCVVTQALQKPCLEVFAYSHETGHWESQSPDRKVLSIQEIIAARCSAT